jgi:hypothetical protein
MVSGDIVQNVGQIDIKFAHHDIHNGHHLGGIMHLGGFKLQGEFLSMAQLVDNSVLVPTLGGGSVQLTNNNQCGQITFASIRTGYLNEFGMPQRLDEQGIPTDSDEGYFDIVSIADAIREIPGGDGVGGTFEISSTFNGSSFSILLLRSTLVRSPPYMASGTDAPNYQTVFNYSRPKINHGVYTASDISNDIIGG